MTASVCTERTEKWDGGEGASNFKGGVDEAAKQIYILIRGQRRRRGGPPKDAKSSDIMFAYFNNPVARSYTTLCVKRFEGILIIIAFCE